MLEGIGKENDRDTEGMELLARNFQRTSRVARGGTGDVGISFASTSDAKKKLPESKEPPDFSKLEPKPKVGVGGIKWGDTLVCSKDEKCPNVVWVWDVCGSLKATITFLDVVRSFDFRGDFLYVVTGGDKVYGWSERGGVKWWECGGAEFLKIKSWEGGVVVAERKSVRAVTFEEDEEEGGGEGEGGGGGGTQREDEPAAAAGDADNSERGEIDGEGDVSFNN